MQSIAPAIYKRNEQTTTIEDLLIGIRPHWGALGGAAALSFTVDIEAWRTATYKSASL